MGDQEKNRAPAHGTRSRHQKHRRDGDRPCEPCMKAESNYRRGREIRNGAHAVRVGVPLVGALLAAAPPAVRALAVAELGRAAVDACITRTDGNALRHSHDPCRSADAARLAADEAVPRG